MNDLDNINLIDIVPTTKLISTENRIPLLKPLPNYYFTTIIFILLVIIILFINTKIFDYVFSNGISQSTG